MDRGQTPTNAEFRAESSRMMKVLKHQLDMIQGDISSIKRDIFLLKTIKEVKSETIKLEPLRQVPKPNTTKEEEYAGGWRFW